MFARIATTAIATAAFGLAALAGTATATANAISIDDQFLTSIDDAGIVFDSTSAAVKDAKQVCSLLADGQTGVDVAGDILDNTDLTAHQAAVFVVESTYAYCPGYAGRVTA